MPLIRKPVTSNSAPAPTTADVLRGLASLNAEERWAAARAAPDVAGGTAALTTALSAESNARVREAMLTSLARINSTESVEALIALLRSDDAGLRTGALDTLRAMGGAISEHLPKLLADADSDIRVLSCEMARGLPGPEATRILCDVLAREQEVNVCGAAVDVLAELGEAEALPVLAECATRFQHTPFLVFAIKVATDRIVAQFILGMSDFPALTEDEFRRLCEFLYRRTGMVFTEAKRYYVERRVVERMIETGSRTFANYFSHLRADTRGEIEQIINAFTVNETYFYREDHQLQCLSSDLLADRVRSKRKGEPIRIWSAPCSTGEEPYSIAMWLLENWPLVDEYEIEIIGSDIDTAVLEAARLGVFGKRALMRLSPHLVARYFSQLTEDKWQILEDLRESVRFSEVNIVESSQTRPYGQFDVIFCRNVLIYFDDSSRRIAAENLYENLLPGGFICLGHTESMSRISSLFDVSRFADAIVYQRPNGSARDP